jgi:uncharacterized delta-60 repeat protein
MKRSLGPLTVVLTLGLSATAVAADGVLDPSFGAGGFRTEQLALAGTFGSFSEGLALTTPPGATAPLPVAAVFAKDADAITKFTTQRLTFGGLPDGGWGTGSVFRHTTPAAGSTNNAIADAGGGKVLVGGIDDPDGAARATLERYTAAGTLDPTFGTGGSGSEELGLPSAVPVTGSVNAVATLPGGKALFAGSFGSGAGMQAAVGRINADGSYDTTFGTGGVRRDVIAKAGTLNAWSAVAAAPGGKIVVTGEVTDAAPGGNVTVVGRYNADGTPDATFGPGGLRYLQLSPLTTASRQTDPHGLAVQPDGKILVGLAIADTYLGPTVDDVAFVAGVTRLQTDGTPDPSFGTGGLAQVQLGSPAGPAAQSDPRDLALQPDGRIVLAGSGVVGGATQLAVARLTSGGTPDPLWGSGGVARTPLAGVTTAGAIAVAVDPARELTYVSGRADDKLLSARYVGNTAPAVTVAGPTSAVASTASLAFDATATDPEGDALSYAWDFDGDGVPDAGLPGTAHVTRAFTAPGVYHTGVVVSDPYGGSATATVTTTVTAAVVPPKGKPKLATLPKTLRLTGRIVTVPLRCLATSPVACDGSVRLYPLAGRLPKASTAKVRPAVSYGTARFTLKPGRARGIRVTLTAAGRRAVSRRPLPHLRLRVHTAAGTTVRRVALRRG